MIENNITILGINYEIIKINNEEINENIGGLHDGFDRKIIIVNHEVERFMKSCLLHESLHAMFFEAGFENYSNDENLIYALEHLLPKVSEEFKKHNLI